MIALLAVGCFFLGTIIGSFLNVLIFRYPENKNIVTGRSMCPHCQTPLAWWQLIPVISYVLLRGQCAHCTQPISVQYPLVELGYGLLFVVIWLPFLLAPAPSIPALAALTLQSVIIALLLVLSIIDLRTFLLPDHYMILLAAAAAVYVWVSGGTVADSLYGLLAGGGFILFLYLVTDGRGIGFGDVKLAAVLGAIVGLQGAVILLLIAFISGGLVGSYLLWRRLASLKTAVPFGPFLAGTAAGLLLWPQLPGLLVSLLLYA